MTRAIALACRAAGMDVRVVTPDNGLGEFAGSVSDVGYQVTHWYNADWPPQVYLDVHTNAGARGCFAVYPEANGDVGAGVRDRLGPDLARRLAEATGIPVWGSGAMSERSTAVGQQGYRLGVFSATASIRSYCTRLIVEFGAHTQPDDLAILQAPWHADAAAQAVMMALVAWMGGE